MPNHTHLGTAEGCIWRPAIMAATVATAHTRLAAHLCKMKMRPANDYYSSQIRSFRHSFSLSVFRIAWMRGWLQNEATQLFVTIFCFFCVLKKDPTVPLAKQIVDHVNSSANIFVTAITLIVGS